MFDGMVNFAAKVKGNGVTFPLFDFNPNQPGVDRVEIEGPNGDGSATFVLGISSSQLKIQLEQPTPPGERNFGLLRSARQSGSPVEEFMHLYNVLLMLFNDRQVDVDSFIVAEDAAVPQTQHPLKAPGTMETVYTRLRNELAHQRAGVVIDQTKAEMANHLGGLIALLPSGPSRCIRR